MATESDSWSVKVKVKKKEGCGIKERSNRGIQIEKQIKLCGIKVKKKKVTGESRSKGK